MTPTDFSVISGIPFGIRPVELYNDWRTEVSPDRMVELIGIDLPRAGPSRLSGPSKAPWAISEATGPLHLGLANLRLPYSIFYYTPDGSVAFREVSLENVDCLDLPSEDITEVPNGLVT
ncbi:hypothetical protein JCGZ_19284 [Jatropha curcas]|uniref:Uncharacterized protein n=1 Tax=Jatropha curcas TaxID=180498 RepID=A0A067K020_JATCU|nr:hypothetical protein JCGZ_19284 [Jatropha curcas]